MLFVVDGKHSKTEHVEMVNGNISTVLERNHLADTVVWVPRLEQWDAESVAGS